MSLAIDTDKVTSVLLADGWHPVIDQSLELEGERYVPTWGFSFKTSGNVRMSGPMSSILAVQTADSG